MGADQSSVGGNKPRILSVSPRRFGGGSCASRCRAWDTMAASTARLASRQCPTAVALRQARKVSAGTSFWPKPPSERSVGVAVARASSANVLDHVQWLDRPLVVADQPCGEGIWKKM